MVEVSQFDMEPRSRGIGLCVATNILYIFLVAYSDSMVKLWDVASLMDEAGSEETSLLATLEHHSKAVNACRWSVDGSYLGSAGDDMLIILYTYTPTATVAKPFGSKAVLSKVCIGGMISNLRRT